MQYFSGFETTALLYEEVRFSLYQGYRCVDGQQVIIKALRSAVFDPLDLTMLKAEFEMTRRLQFPHVLRPVSLELTHGASVWEYVTGRPPDSRSFFSTYGIAGFLDFAIKVVEALGDAHQHQVAHQNIRPIHLLYDPEKHTVRLFGFSAVAPRAELNEHQDQQNQASCISYMSPEQTGRINRKVGLSGDLYSLGVVFYELLSGQLPFTGSDPMEVIHGHLARQQRPLRALNELVPEVVASIIDKLLHKTPEDRYRSLFGLARDLRHCAQLLADHSEIKMFPIGAADVNQHFGVPEKLYGRSLELEQMATIFKKTRKGQARLVLLSGAAGVGKTALAREFRKTVFAANGLFVTGLCEESKNEIPYKPLIDGFYQLVHHILAAPAPELERWRDQLHASLGSTAQAIVDVVPDLELIMGHQSELPPLEAVESKNRFRVALLKFIKVFARKEHPLVLFLDNLQWAGSSTLEVVKSLLNGTQMSHLLIVGAYRHEAEGEKTDVFKQLAGHVEHIPLGPVDLLNIQEMLVDALGVPPSQNKSLAELALQRSQGNPLHVGLYLRSLYEKGLLAYVAKLGRWNWDAALISAQERPDDSILILIKEKIDLLSPQTLSLLQLAACIGTRFNLRLLSVAHQTSQLETAHQLTEAIQAGLVVPLHDRYLLTTACDEADFEAMSLERLDLQYEFLHTQVQQTIYETMVVSQSKMTHLRVGKLFLAYAHAHALDDHVFGIVNQLNQCHDLVANGEERMDLARLNFEAGLKARDAAAYPDACTYLRVTQSLLPEDAATRDYGLFFQSKLVLAEMSCFAESLEEGERLFNALLPQAVSRQNKALVYEKHLTLLINLGRLDEAVRIGKEGLALFDLEFPQNPDALASFNDQRYEAVAAWLSEHTDAQILALPTAVNNEHEHLMSMMMHLTPAAFNTNQDLFCYLTLLQIEQVIKHGHNRLSAYACASLGILLGMHGEYSRGFDIAHLALDVNALFPDPLIRNRLLFIGCNLVNHWRQPVRDDLATLTRIFRFAEQQGDLVYANYAQLVISHHRWFVGEPLLKIIDEAEQHVGFAIQTRNEAAYWTHRLLVQAILNLRGLTNTTASLDSVDFETEACFDALTHCGYFTGLSLCHIIQIEVLFLNGHHHEAWSAFARSQKLLPFSTNLVMQTTHVFYHALLLASRVTVSVAAMEMLDEAADRLGQWAHLCPDNFEAMHQIVEGERARILSQDLAAMRHYQQAIRKAKALRQSKFEAIAHERAFLFFEGRAFNAYATHHLMAALEAYSTWGATAKVEELRKKHGTFLATSSPTTPDSTMSQSDQLDKITLLKAAQAISGEIEVNRLLAKMMRFVVENAGAQRGVFLIQEGGRLMVGAEWYADQREVGLSDGVNLNSRDDLSKPVITYVQRTRSDLVISDISQNDHFVGDPYLQSSGVQAVLCMPVLRQTELLGILYLENHLARGTFSEDRLEMLRLLTPQMAVSLENAQFITNMASLNDELTREIQERQKAELALRKAKEIAVANARNAGKAEFASSVLHNINNVLNTVAVAAEGLVDVTTHSKSKNLEKAMAMVANNKENLADFFSKDPRGQLLPNYLADLSVILKGEFTFLESELEVLRNHIRLMRDIIETQQRHAKGVLSLEKVDLVLLCDDVLHIQRQGLERHNIVVVRDFACEDPVAANKANLTHIVINLVKNAIEAMGFQEQRMLTLRTKQTTDAYTLQISDTGVGISVEAMAQMFTHGLTTKEDGHGFGLHYCRKAMEEMNGSIEVHSEGAGMGASFVLTFAKV